MSFANVYSIFDVGCHTPVLLFFHNMFRVLQKRSSKRPGTRLCDYAMINKMVIIFLFDVYGGSE